MIISYEQQDALSEKYQDLEIFFHGGNLDVNRPRVDWGDADPRFYTIRTLELDFEDVEKLLELFDQLFKFSRFSFADFVNYTNEITGPYNLTLTVPYQRRQKHENHAKTIRSILEKDWSNEHKMFTLLCAARIGSEVSTERILYLAEKLSSSVPNNTFTHNSIALYLIPASFNSSVEALEFSQEELISAYNNPDLEMLIEFIHSSNDKDSEILIRNLQDYADSFVIAESVPKVDHITVNVLLIVTQLLESEHFEEVLKMTPKTLRSFSSIITGHTHINYPVEPLVNRAKAMNGYTVSYAFRSTNPINYFLHEYCNFKEIEILRSLDGFNNLKKFSNLREELVKNKSAMACLIEVAVARGPKIALEVLEFVYENWKVSSLSDVTTNRGSRSAEAYVDLICVPLKPENHDFPFAWLAALHPRTVKV